MKKNPTSIALKVPPHSKEAEKAVLGSVLVDKTSMLKVADILEPRDFYFEIHQEVFDAMRSLFEQHTPIDILTISNELKIRNKLDIVGGIPFLGELSSQVPSAANIVNYGLIVKEKSTRRKMIQAGDSIMGLGYQEEHAIENDLEQAEKHVFNISQTFLRNKFIPIKEVLSHRFDFFASLHGSDAADTMAGVPSGFHQMDEMLNGLKPSDFIIIAARPSMGKTAFALNIAMNAAMKHNKRVGIFSLEMSKEQLVDRLFSMTVNVDSWKLHKGKLSDEEFQKLGVGLDELMQSPIYIDDTVGASLAEVRAKARRLQMEHGLDMIVIDYLQLMSSGEGDGSNRVQEISEISRSLKQLGRELNVPVITLSQLSRAVESRPGKVPQLSDLRDSGSIEQDADVVLMLYREEYYEADTDRKGIMDVFVKKNRNGPVGRLELNFNMASQKFTGRESLLQLTE